MNPLERRVAKLEAQRTDAPRNLFIQIYGDDTVEAYLAQCSRLPRRRIESLKQHPRGLKGVTNGEPGAA